MAEQGQSDQSEWTMGTACCLFKTVQIKLKDACGWFVEDFLAKFLHKIISGISEVAEAGTDFRHRAPSSLRVRGTLPQLLLLNWCSHLILTLQLIQVKRKGQ